MVYWEILFLEGSQTRDEDLCYFGVSDALATVFEGHLGIEHHVRDPGSFRHQTHRHPPAPQMLS